jgi:flagellin
MSRLTINSNIASLNAQRNFGTATKKLSESYTRLSSGLRINKASDDAAGLSISESLKADTRLFNQGVRNLNDGASVLNIADGALSELSSIMIRLNELAEQSANGTLGNKQRQALDQEAQSLSKEYNRIARTTEFNGRKIFNGDFGDLSLAAGGGRESLIIEDLGGAIGDGTFKNSVSLAVVGLSTALAVDDVTIADLNGDGFEDIIVDNYVSSNIYIIINKGDGTFQTSTSIGLNGATNPISVITGDYNKDGFVDIIAATEGAVFSVILGNGNGTYKTAVNYNNVVGQREIISADLNNDGNLDIATTHGYSSSTIGIMYGNSDGSFKARLSIATGTALGLVAEDFNNDGYIDLVNANHVEQSIQVNFGDASGTFKSTYTFAPTGVSPFNMVSGDMNNDGFKDLISNNLASGTVSVYFGTNQGTFKAGNIYNTGGTNLNLSDFNGDGNLDLSLANDFSNNIQVFLGNGDGSLKLNQDIITTTLSTTTKSLDINNDGVEDLISMTTDAVMTYLGNLNSGVSALQSFSLKTQQYSRDSMSYLRKTLESIGQQRGHIGAFQSRVETATSNLYQSSLAYSEANSRITDADIAEESSKLTANQILQQSAASVLAQANQQPRLVLSLLGGI